MARKRLRVDVICQVCGITFWVHPSRLARGNVRCCSMACRGLLSRQLHGPAHPLWQGGTHPHSYRRAAFTAHGAACVRCGSTRKVEVHHKDRNRQNNDLANLEPICASCHRREHGVGGDVRHTTHCPQGHAYSEENTGYNLTRQGYRTRYCRTCRREHGRARTQRARNERVQVARHPGRRGGHDAGEDAELEKALGL